MRIRVVITSLGTRDGEKKNHKTTKNSSQRGLMNMKRLAEAKHFERELYEEAV